MSNDEHDQSTPVDVTRIGRVMDRVIAADSARPGLEERMFEGSLAALKSLGPTQDAVGELGRAERAAAPAHLEPAVAVASAPALTAGAGTGSARLHLAGEGRLPSGAGRRAPWITPGRIRNLAAVLVIGLGAVVVFRTVNPTPTGRPGGAIATNGAAGMSTTEIAARVEEGFDVLYTAMEDMNAIADSDWTAGSAKIDELLEEGAS